MEEKITTFLTFDDQAQEAIHFYLARFASCSAIPTPRNRSGS